MTKEKTNNKKAKGVGGRIKSLLGGSLLASEKVMRQLPFVFFLVLLSMLLISNRYWSEKTIRQMEAVQDSMKELKAESVTYETELMKMNRPTEISNRVKESGLDLIDPQEPARRINVKKLDQE